MQFSIVIPTRSRALKLRHALRSALAQSWGDYEVVVSNNCSQDDTEQVVIAQSHPRLRYVKAPRPMSMVEHWEFALGQARGEWVLFVCDDDALMPGALASLAATIARRPIAELIQYGVLVYVYDDGTAVRGNYVDLPDRVPRIERTHNARRCLARSFRRLSGDMPKFLNSAVNARLIERVRKHHGRVFWDWAPDYSSASLLLANTRRFIRTGPLMLWGENQESYGAGSARNPAHMASFFQQFDTFGGELAHSPYPSLLTVQNCVYDTFCGIRKLLGREFDDLEIDPVRFRRILIKDCARYVANGHKSYRHWVRQLERDLSRVRWQRVFDPAWAAGAMADGAEDFILRMSRSIERRLHGTRRKRRHYFGNIAEAAEFAGRLACPTAAAAHADKQHAIDRAA